MLIIKMILKKSLVSNELNIFGKNYRSNQVEINWFTRYNLTKRLYKCIGKSVT